MRPFQLGSSYKVLVFPDGSVDEDTLSNLLEQAKNHRLPLDRKVKVTYSVRNPKVDHYGDRPDLLDPDESELHVDRTRLLSVGTLNEVV